MFPNNFQSLLLLLTLKELGTFEGLRHEPFVSTRTPFALITIVSKKNLLILMVNSMIHLKLHKVFMI